MYIFDATVLSSFGVVRRLDLLERRYAGRANWSIEVQDEIMRGLRGVPVLSEILTAPWLLPPIRSFAVDRIERIRLQLGGRPRDRRHLGEAATIVIAAQHGWVVATDDRDATRLTRAEGLRTIGTIPILQACVRDGFVTPEAARRLRDEMVDVHGRRLPEVSVDDFR